MAGWTTGCTSSASPTSGISWRASCARSSIARSGRPIAQGVLGAALRCILSGMEQDEPHLLVVDDDARIRELLRRYLAGSGFRVTVAGDAAEARSKLASMEFDLVVLDVMMPGENGFDLTRSLRETGTLRKIGRTPILLLTAMAEP